MAIPHARPGQAIDVRPLGARLAGETTTALFKSDQLEVIRLVLVAGKSLPTHQVSGVLACATRLTLSAAAQGRSMQPGSAVGMAAGVTTWRARS